MIVLKKELAVRKLSLWLFPLFLLIIAGLPFLGGKLTSQDGIVKVDTPVSSPLFDRFEAPHLLVFFGYAGCAEICTPRLDELAGIYRDFTQQQQADTDVAFINISDVSDPELPGLFAASFHPDFKALTPGKKELHRLMGIFSARYAPSLLEQGEYVHTAFLYLLKRKPAGYALEGIVTDSPFRGETVRRHLFGQR
jgi:protein SCO1/2